MPMTYRVYENWRAQGHYTKIHRSECGSCKNGQGIYPDLGHENGAWNGPRNFARSRSDCDIASDLKNEQSKQHVNSSIAPNQKTILALRSGHRCVLYREPLIVDATEYDGAQILGYVTHIKGITGTG